MERNLDRTQKIVFSLSLARLNGPFKFCSFMLSCNYCRGEISVDMALASRTLGRHSKECLQFETTRKLRTAYRNFERVSSVKTRNSLVIGGARNTKGSGNVFSIV